MPIGSTYRYGIAPTANATGGWVGPSTYDTAHSIIISTSTFGDPASGKIKEFDVLQTLKTQTIFYTLTSSPGTLKAVTIPAYVPPITTPTTAPILTMTLPDGLFSNCRFGYVTASDNKEYFYMLCNPTAPIK